VQPYREQANALGDNTYELFLKSIPYVRVDSSRLVISQAERVRKFAWLQLTCGSPHFLRFDNWIIMPQDDKVKNKI